MRRGWAVLLAGLAAAAPPGDEAARTVVLVSMPMPGQAPPGAAPPPVTLHVPAAFLEPAAVDGERPVLVVRAVLPGFAAAPPGTARCGRLECGDEVTATMRLVPGPPPVPGPGTAKEAIEAGPLGKVADLVVEALPPPPGFEEAVRLFKPSPPRRSYLGVNLELLVFRDAGGRKQSGSCDLGQVPPRCSFGFYDPETHLGVVYALPMPELERRQIVEDGFRRLVASWVSP